ncbi:MAG: TIGR03619 family F420-dependent LLM class oxidoreductase [Deltaproteobacteria bacterium]|jgi:probable F420-dependent oxidoreductase|nr:TIGR03619 family F420-dependent LLM class oxidoreductase [Deltaproteobacteria bacterium]MBW2497038.1 TIGR03619 family F420-dependent LLM class oxidoreductase [Deltaproteobacteria bacterium]
MRFAYHATMCSPDLYLPLAVEVEKAGFDTFTLPDSICYPEESDSKYPYNGTGDREFLDGVPFLDPFSLIPAMGAVTTTLRFTTSVMKLAIRQPVVVAKSVSSVAVLTGNRFGFGVGISPWPDDFAACQIPWERRGKRMDEMIDIVKGLMGGEYFSYEGEIFQLDSIKICPAPSEPVPILIGGHAKPALRRAARVADGFIHAGGSFEELAATVKQIEEYRKEYGRDHLPFEYQSMSADAFSVDGVRRLEDLGIQEAIVAFRNPYEAGLDTQTLGEKVAAINWFADNVIHKLD